MIIESLWGLRKGEEEPELMAAWDEFSIDQNLEGWREACEQAIASWKSDLVDHRIIKLAVADHKIHAAFDASTITADVVDD